MIVTPNVRINRIITGTWRNLLFSVLTCIIAYFINDSWLKNHFVFPVFVPTVLGTALAFFIGFNNTHAYDRWWESRKVWGSLVNNSRTWTRQIICYTQLGVKDSPAELDEKRKKMIKRHIGFLYALKSFLRNSGSKEYEGFLPPEEVKEISGQSNKHNAILTIQSRDLELLYQQGNIDGFKLIEFNKMITAFCDDMGKSERIKNTIFPTTYNSYAKGFIWIFVYSVTMTIGNSIGIWAILFGTLLGYVFFTIQALGQSLLNPFDNTPTGIALDQITRTIEINLLEMLQEENIPTPVQTVNGEYIM